MRCTSWSSQFSPVDSIPPSNLRGGPHKSSDHGSQVMWPEVMTRRNARLNQACHRAGLCAECVLRQAQSPGVVDALLAPFPACAGGAAVSHLMLELVEAW